MGYQLSANHFATNGWRDHSGAARAQVSVTRQDDRVTVVVADEGRGFDPAEIAESGIGLAGMLERSRLVGGQLSIESAPDAGTRVTVSLLTVAATTASCVKKKAWRSRGTT